MLFMARPLGFAILLQVEHRKAAWEWSISAMASDVFQDVR
jgi:hypothetical protein